MTETILYNPTKEQITEWTKINDIYTPLVILYTCDAWDIPDLGFLLSEPYRSYNITYYYDPTGSKTVEDLRKEYVEA